MSGCLTFSCCGAGQVSQTWSIDGQPLVRNMQESTLHAFDVTAGTEYFAGQIVDFSGVMAIALQAGVVAVNGTMAFLTHGDVNKDLLLKADGVTPAVQADFDAIMPSINPVAVSA